MNITGNVISGQVTGATAKTLSDRIGKTMQDRESFSINSNDTSVSQSKQLETAIPVSTIASSGEFVGTVTDDPDQKIELKAFCCEIVNDHQLLKKELADYKDLEVVSNVEQQLITDNYLEIKKEVAAIIENENGENVKYARIGKFDG